MKMKLFHDLILDMRKICWVTRLQILYLATFTMSSLGLLADAIVQPINNLYCYTDVTTFPFPRVSFVQKIQIVQNKKNAKSFVDKL